MRSIASVLGLLSLLGCRPEPPIGPAPPARPSIPEGLAGCYALLGGGERPVSTYLYHAPSHVRLLAEKRQPSPYVGPQPRGWALTKLDSLLRPEADQDPMNLEKVFWEMHSSPDSVVLWFHTGLSGSLLFLEVPPGPVDTLRGRATQHFDFGPVSFDSGEVLAVRVRC